MRSKPCCDKSRSAMPASFPNASSRNSPPNRSTTAHTDDNRHRSDHAEALSNHKKSFRPDYFYPLYICRKYYSMSILRIPILFVGSKGEKHLSTLFDTGADLSAIHPDVVKELETPVKLGRVRHLSTASTAHLIEAKERGSLDFVI